MLDALPAIWSEQAPTFRFRGRTIAGLRSEPRPMRPGDRHEHQKELLAFINTAPQTLLG